MITTIVTAAVVATLTYTLATWRNMPHWPRHLSKSVSPGWTTAGIDDEPTATTPMLWVVKF